MTMTVAGFPDGGQVPGQFGTFNGTDSPIDPYNRKLEYALSDLDQRHRFVGSVVYIPQFTKLISNKTLRLIADGFVFSTIVSAGSGQPVTAPRNAEVGRDRGCFHKLNIGDRGPEAERGTECLTLNVGPVR